MIAARSQGYSGTYIVSTNASSWCSCAALATHLCGAPSDRLPYFAKDEIEEDGAGARGDVGLTLRLTSLIGFQDIRKSLQGITAEIFQSGVAE